MQHNRTSGITTFLRLASLAFGILLVLNLVPSQAQGQTYEGFLGNTNEILQRALSKVSLDDDIESSASSVIDVLMLGLTGASKRDADSVPVNSMSTDMQVQDDYTGGIRIHYRKTGTVANSAEYDAQKSKIYFVIKGPDGSVVEKTYLSDFYEADSISPYWTKSNLAPGTYVIEEHDYNFTNAIGTVLVGNNAEKMSDNSIKVNVGNEVDDVTIITNYTKENTGAIVLRLKELLNGNEIVGGIVSVTPTKFYLSGPDGYEAEIRSIDFDRYYDNAFDRFTIVNDLEPGKYTLFESNLGWSDRTIKTTYSGVDSTHEDEANFTVGSGKLTDVTVTDAYTDATTGSLDITKYIYGSEYLTGDEQEILFKVYGDDGSVRTYPISMLVPYPDVRTPDGKVTKGYSGTIVGLTPGDYMIAERVTVPSGVANEEKFEITAGTGVKERHSVNVVSNQESSVRFTNTYRPSSSAKTGTLTINKYVQGIDLESADEQNMTFTVYGPEEGEAETRTYNLGSDFTKNRNEPLDHSYSLTINNLASGLYTITENANIAGYTRQTYFDGTGYVSHDDNVCKFRVNNTGTNTVGIVNMYSGGTPTPTPTQIDLKATVKLATGNTWPSGGVATLTLSPVTAGAPMPAGTTGSASASLYGPGTAEFKDINFGNAAIGQYVYNVTQTLSDEWGNDWETSPSNPVTIRVNVDGNHNISYDASAPNDPTITNTKKSPSVTPAEVHIKVKKKISGDRGWKAGDEFDFTLSAHDNYGSDVTMPSDTTATVWYDSDDHAEEFDTILINKAGEYQFDVVEAKGLLSDITYNTDVHYRTIKVEESNGKLIDADGGNNLSPTITVTNSSSGTPSVTTHKLKVTNTVNGDGVTEEDKQKNFSFKVKYVTAAQASAGKGGTTTESFGLKSGESKTFTVASGTSYEVTQTTLSGFKKTTPSNASGTMKDSDITVSFLNTKNGSSGDVSLEITATKKLSGRALADKEFSFELKDGSGETLQTTRNNSDGSISFYPITYSEVGTHNYTITEVNDHQTGVTYDGHSARVTVNVIETSDGDLTTDTHYVNSTFNNSYTDPENGKFVLVAKVDGDLEMKDLSDEDKEKITFKLEGPGGEYSRKLSEFVETADGLAWTEPNLVPGEYALTEWNAEQDGYDLLVTIRGAKPVEGDMIVTVATGKTSEVTLTNNYTDLSKGSIVITKSVADDLSLGNLTDAEKKDMTFAVEKRGGSKYSNVLSGFVSGATWTIKKLEPGEYTITETHAKKDGYDLTVSFKGVTKTTATSDAGGVATVKVEAGKRTEVTITNSYKKNEEPSVTTHKLKITNTVKGTGVTSEDKQKNFSFKVTYVTAAQASAGNGETTTDTFSLKSGESKTFTVASDTSYEVTQTTLSGFEKTTPSNASGTMKDKDITVSFLNTKNGSSSTTGKASIKITATKKLSGRSLSANEFSFDLKDSSGRTIQTKSNASGGTISFDSIEYSSAGTYNYTITEVNNNKTGITYDTHSAKVTVTVTENSSGKLSAQASYSNATFNNTYKDDSKTTSSSSSSNTTSSTTKTSGASGSSSTKSNTTGSSSSNSSSGSGSSGSGTSGSSVASTSGRTASTGTAASTTTTPAAKTPGTADPTLVFAAPVLVATGAAGIAVGAVRRKRK